MAQVLGAKSRIIVDFETTYGADPAAPNGILLPVNTYSLAAKRAKHTPKTITGSRNPVKPFSGNLVDSGEAVVPVDYTAFGYWLKAMFGNPTTTGTGPYTHVFKVGDSMPSMVHEVRYADQSAAITYAKHNGVKVRDWSMTIGGDEELVATIGLEGANETFSTTPYDATPSTPTLGRLNNFQAALTEGGVALGRCTSLNFSVDFGLTTDQFTIGSGGIRAGLPEGLLAITGSMTTLFQDMTLLNKALNSNETSLVMAITSGTNSLTITFNELEFERQTPGITGPQGVLLSLPFVAFMDDHVSASAVEATLVNTTASYA